MQPIDKLKEFLMFKTLRSRFATRFVTFMEWYLDLWRVHLSKRLNHLYLYHIPQWLGDIYISIRAHDNCVALIKGWQTLANKWKYTLVILSWMLTLFLVLKPPMTYLAWRHDARQLGSGFTPTVLHWEQDIIHWSRQYQLPPNLIASAIQTESCGNPHQISTDNEYGLFQVPEFQFDANETLLDPNIGASYALPHLRRCYLTFGDNTVQVLACYQDNPQQSLTLTDPIPMTAITMAGIYWEAHQEQNRTLQQWLAETNGLTCQRAQAAINERKIVRQ